jgi:hypothetical protein
MFLPATAAEKEKLGIKQWNPLNKATFVALF